MRKRISRFSDIPNPAGGGVWEEKNQQVLRLLKTPLKPG
jgi:hypothetical protein